MIPGTQPIQASWGRLTIRTLPERGVGNSTEEPTESQSRTRPWSCWMVVALVAEERDGDAYDCCELITLPRTKPRVCRRTWTGGTALSQRTGPVWSQARKGAQSPEPRWMRRIRDAGKKPNFRTPSQGGSRGSRGSGPVGGAAAAGQTRAVAAAQGPAFCGPLRGRRS